MTRHSRRVTRDACAAAHGFTLIELLVVIAIIGILASVTIASISGARGRARDAERVSEVGQIALSVELYYDACKEYPSSLSASASNCPGSSGVTFGDFITTIPTDPRNTSPYVYVYKTDGTHSQFVVRAVLETNAAALQDDLDGGNVLGIGCNESATNFYYCVGS